jgi:hypothetical protein
VSAALVALIVGVIAGQQGVAALGLGVLVESSAIGLIVRARLRVAELSRPHAASSKGVAVPAILGNVLALVAGVAVLVLVIIEAALVSLIALACVLFAAISYCALIYLHWRAHRSRVAVNETLALDQ